jgi:hypothetical protein
VPAETKLLLFGGLVLWAILMVVIGALLAALLRH